jgi:hypothetical protein
MVRLARATRRVLFVFVLSVPLCVFFAGSATTASGAKPAATLTFGHAVVVDHQRVTGEPSLSVSSTLNASGHHDVYVSAPFGFSTTASFIWKSPDGGQTFHLVGAESPAAAGKPAMTCAGGGDSSLVNDTAGRLYFADLQGLTDVSDSVSSDGGNTFVSTCNSANATGVDRPWLAAYGDPFTTGREYMTVDQTAQCTINCGLGQAGSNMLEVTQTNGAAAATQVFSPLPAQQIEPDGIVGGAVVDQRNGDLYIVHTGLTDNNGAVTGGGDGNGNTNAIVVDRFPGGYNQTVATPVPPTSISLCAPYNPSGPCRSETVVHSPLDANGNSTVNNGQDFATMAIDTSGNLYVVWAQSPVDSSGNVDGPTTIYLATSTDGGATWTSPINVSSHVSGLQTNVFPWLAAGAAGRVDIVWYGTPTLGSCPNEPCGAGFINASWNVYMAQTLDAVSNAAANASPTFSTTKVSEYPIHFGTICEFGIACTTGGDRGLLDFIQVAADPSGAADIVYADGANNAFNGGETSAVIDFVQQVGGPGLYGTTVSGPTPATGSAPGSPASYYAANGSEIAAPPNSNVDIVQSSISASKNAYTVTMQVGNLLSLLPDPTLGGSDVVWLTRWELPVAQPTTSTQGHFFYAAMESDNGGPPTFYDGDAVCGIATTHCKFLTYPPGHSVTGSYSPSGTITITVPFKDVGGSTKAQLYSVTGVTATQTEPASTGAAIFNVIDSTPPYDVAPKGSG